MPYKLSPSSLNLLKECPRCFWLHHNKKIRRPEGIFPSLPGGMDRILKTHFDFFMENNSLPPELRELEGVKLFNNKELLKEWRNNLKGIQWTDKKGNLLRGAVDNILVKGDKLIVLDYKTRGYPLKEDTAAHYQNQLDIYNFLLRKNNKETEDYAYLLFYHPEKVDENGKVIFNTDLVKMKTDIKNAENIFKKAIQTLEGDMPKPDKDCDYCKWIEANYEIK
ncbi:PD-(D/E)XK nuclease family protein [Candidatus Woesearchaeota archaeon]|nr:PD-(D/E)XK nuclease family protein [Candidatus Woesearchaeota archaeon]